LRKGNPSQVEAICSELFNPKHLKEIATDKFSNFVVQRGLEVSKGQNQAIYINRIQEISQDLKTFKYGRYVLNCLEKIQKKSR
jgi:hypothetical protein